MDTLTITGLEYIGRHGCLAAERELGQRFVVDLAIHYDAERAGLSDDLADAVDYSRVYDLVGEIVAGEPSHLIEAVAERIAANILGRWPLVASLGVTVHKPGAPIGGHVRDIAITISRGRRP